MKNTY